MTQLEPFDRRFDEESKVGPIPVAPDSRSPEAIRRCRKACTAFDLTPTLSSADAGTLFQPPRSTMPW